jgi:hypothetical protein
MVKFITIFLLAAVCQAQTVTEIFSGFVLNGQTTNAASNFSISTDSLLVYIQGGSDNTLDSARAHVYVQTFLFGRWSQGRLIDSVVAPGIPSVKFDSVGIGGTSLRADSLRNLWFYGTSISGSAKNALLAQSGWLTRIYIVGTAFYPSLSGNATNGNKNTGGLVKVFRLKW